MISVVVPVRDEEQSLAALHGELDAVFADGTRGPVEFIFVDDGSRDGSWAVLAALASARSSGASDPFSAAISAKRRPSRLGSWRRAAKRFSLSTATSRTTRRRFRAFLIELDKGYDVVSGWKKTRHDPWHKDYPSRVFNWMVSRVCGCRLHDHNCGFKLYKGEVVREIGIYGELHRFIPVLAHARGFKVAEVDVHHRSRRHGASKYGFSRFLKGFLDLLTVRFLTRFSQLPLPCAHGGIGLYRSWPWEAWVCSIWQARMALIRITAGAHR